MQSTNLPQAQLGLSQDLTLFKVYTFYRLILSMGLLTTFLVSQERLLVGSFKPTLFLYSTSIYLIINLFYLAISLPKKIQFNQQQLFVNFFIDIVAIILMSHASGGIVSGMQILLIVTVAAGSIMLTSQLPILLAAITSLLIITETALLVKDQHLDSSVFLASGLLGGILFIAAFFIQTLAKRIRGAQQMAAQRAIDVSQLQLLNRQILQSMRTGVLVTNSDGYLQMANAAASELLGNKKLSGSFQQIGAQVLPSILMMQLKQWQSSPQYHTAPFRATETGPELQASFSSLGKQGQDDILIFIENNYLVAQRAQQLKLASLGRLTASIAHEIRNPLSAISHAAQLLNESDTIDQADKKLSNIIQKHSQRMDKVIENVLQLSRRSSPKLESICLNDWLAQLIQDIEQEYKDPVAISLLPTSQQYEIKTDPSQLTQVITNLVQNGLRYSLSHTGKATLALKIAINPNTQLPILDIIDDGLGVDDKARANLFEPFYTTEAKGTGLGLYISRELCEANQAQLDYIRTEEGKSCFRISFPHPDRRLSPEIETT